jgi:hypothetical protein
MLTRVVSSLLAAVVVPVPADVVGAAPAALAVLVGLPLVLSELLLTRRSLLPRRRLDR